MVSTTRMNELLNEEVGRKKVTGINEYQTPKNSSCSPSMLLGSPEIDIPAEGDALTKERKQDRLS